jgi:hypothetical protein
MQKNELFAPSSVDPSREPAIIGASNFSYPRLQDDQAIRSRSAPRVAITCSKKERARQDSNL